MSGAVTSAVEVEPVRERQARERFIRFPWRLYEGDAAWVPPLLSDERKFLSPEHNPFFEHSEVELFLARRGREIVGRIAAIRNDAHNDLHGDRVGFFGLFESVDDVEVAAALFDAAETWLGARGLDTMRGPMSFSTNDTCGLFVGGSGGPPFILMPYNPAYYVELVERCGFHKAKDLLAYLVVVADIDAERTQRLREVLARKRDRGVRVDVRSLVKKDWDREVGLIQAIYNRAWEKNWGFVPFTDAEFQHLATHMKQIVDPELVAILELDGVPAGFGLALPDMNLAIREANGRLFPFGIVKVLLAARRVRRVRVPILGILPEFRGRGYDMALYDFLLAAARRKGIVAGESSWILEDNIPMCRAMERLGATVHRTYRIYDRAVAAGSER